MANERRRRSAIETVTDHAFSFADEGITTLKTPTDVTSV